MGQVRSILQAGHLAVNKCNFTLLQEGDVGQVRSILQSGHLAVNAADENETTAVQVDTTAFLA